MLTYFAQESIRRSWIFTYIGVAALGAPPLARLCRWAQRRKRIAQAATVAGVAGLLTAVLIGNVASQHNELWRFPGPYVYGSDTRSQTAELLEAARWFRATQGIEQSVVTDRYVGQVFLSFGLQWTPLAHGGFPS